MPRSHYLSPTYLRICARHRWEFLRRSPAYREDFAAYERARETLAALDERGRKDSGNWADFNRLEVRIMGRYGLWMPPLPPELPAGRTPEASFCLGIIQTPLTAEERAAFVEEGLSDEAWLTLEVDLRERDKDIYKKLRAKLKVARWEEGIQPDEGRARCSKYESYLEVWDQVTGFDGSEYRRPWTQPRSRPARAHFQAAYKVIVGRPFRVEDVLESFGDQAYKVHLLHGGREDQMPKPFWNWWNPLPRERKKAFKETVGQKLLMPLPIGDRASTVAGPAALTMSGVFDPQERVWDAEGLVENGSAEPDASAQRRQLCQKLRSFLGPEQYVAIEQQVMGDASEEDIARKLACSQEHVRELIKSGLEQARKSGLFQEPA